MNTRLIPLVRVVLTTPFLFIASLLPATAQLITPRSIHPLEKTAELIPAVKLDDYDDSNPDGSRPDSNKLASSDWAGSNWTISDLTRTDWASSAADVSAGGDAASPAESSPAEPSLPSAPEPGGMGAGYDHYAVAPAAYWHQIPLSRIGIGADISPLGIGIKAAIVLNQNFDARFNGDYFSYPNANFVIDGFNITGDIHMASAAASLDWYPFGSIFRLSPGVMFYNGNHVSATGNIAGGTSFTLGSQTYYSARTNHITGATPLSGTGTLGLHTHSPALTLAAGFGSFVPRSNRHWSFPSEFGVVFMGAPTIDVNLKGWACTDAAETQCSNIASPFNPIAIEFNQNFQSRIQKWRNDVGVVTVYPIFSYSVVYSFNIR